MGTFKRVFLFVCLTLLSLPAVAHNSSYSGYRSGISINLGHHHNGIQLNYSNAKKHQNNYYDHYYGKKPAHYKNSRPLGHSYSDRHNKRSYSDKRFRQGYYPDKTYQRWSNYKPYTKGYKHNHRPKGFNTYPSSYSQKSCQPVTKIISDSSGLYQSIQSLICYDNSGRAHIVDRHHHR